MMTGKYSQLLQVKVYLCSSTSSDFGHDKSLTLRPYAQLPADIRPTMFYAGDGVSDLSAARESDLLFAKKGKGIWPNPISTLRILHTNPVRFGLLLRARRDPF